MVLRPLALAAAIAIVFGVTAAAQTARRPRPQFVTFTIDNLHTEPLHFGSWPVEQLVGREVTEAQRQPFEYQTRDQRTTIDVVEYKRRGRGLGLTVYPLGLSTGATIGIRVSREDLPVIRLAITGPSDVRSYALTGARAYDGGVAIYVSDRAPGWGLGSHAFVGGGAGVVRSDLSDGHRIFAEGGGGLNVGPIGVQLAVKFALNRLSEPVGHRVVTVPVSLRLGVSF